MVIVVCISEKEKKVKNPCDSKHLFYELLCKNNQKFRFVHVKYQCFPNGMRMLKK